MATSTSIDVIVLGGTLPLVNSVTDFLRAGCAVGRANATTWIATHQARGHQPDATPPASAAYNQFSIGRRITERPKAVFHREMHEFGAALQSNLGHDRGTMGFHGSLGNAQGLGNFCIGVA